MQLEKIQAELTTLYNCHWQFKELIKERDSLIDSEGYNQRCQEIDDQLIPDIINQVPKGMMNQFNQLINS